MPKNIRKSLRDYLSKIKTSRSQIHLPSNKWIPRGCKHPITLSFSLRDKRNKAHGFANNNNEATLIDIDRFLFDNFRSLFLGDGEETHQNNNNNNKVQNNTKCVSSEESHGKARSSSSTSPTTQNGDDPCSKETMAFPNNCVAVLACSKSPYEEFKRSMESVVEERLRNDEKVDSGFMEELLFCYMNMNEKRSHKFITAAFEDLTTVMHHPPQPTPAKPRSVRTVRIGKEIRKETKEVTLESESSKI